MLNFILDQLINIFSLSGKHLYLVRGKNCGKSYAAGSTWWRDDEGEILKRVDAADSAPSFLVDHFISCSFPSCGHNKK